MVNLQKVLLTVLLAPALAYAASYVGDCICPRVDDIGTRTQENSGMVNGVGAFTFTGYSHTVTGGNDGQCAQDGCEATNCKWIFTPSFSVETTAVDNNHRWKFKVRRATGTGWVTAGTSGVQEGAGTLVLNIPGLVNENLNGCGDPGEVEFKVKVSWNSRPSAGEPWSTVWSAYGLIGSVTPGFDCGPCPDIEEQ